MSVRRKALLATVFETVPDPRSEKRAKLHRLTDVLFMVVTATLCNIQGWRQIEIFAKTRIVFFRRFLELPNGVPCSQTFGRILAKIDPKAFMAAFVNWTDRVRTVRAGEQLCFDGKRVRGASGRMDGTSVLHLVDVWATKARLSLAHRKVDSKHNEVEAMLELLEIVDAKGTVISIDAIACQPKMAEAIAKKKAAYILALKGNQKTLHEEVKLFFQDLLAGGLPGVPYDLHESHEKGHGRIESRKVCASSDITWLEDRARWKDLRSVVMVESRRQIKGKTTTQQRFYLTSLPPEAARLGRYIRHHWHIENRSHWVLDVSFGEDRCQVHAKNAAENFAVLRKLALNQLRRESSRPDLTGPVKRILAACDEQYLLKVLMA